MMIRQTKTLAVAALLLFGAAGCGDLVVENTRNPNAEQALQNPGDVESLIAGSWTTWWLQTYHYNAAGPMLSVMSFQHSAYPANFGMVHYSAIPRVTTGNSTAQQFYGQFANAYTWGYRAIAAANDGLRAIEAGTDLGDDEERAIAFARLVQGLSYAHLALMFDRGPVVDETTVVQDEAGNLVPLEFADYNEMMDAALDFLDQAIAIASENSFEIPGGWMNQAEDVSDERFVRIAHSYKARFRAAVARTPEERAAVDWQAVLDDIDAGVEDDFGYTFTGSGYAWQPSLYYTLLGGWSQMNYMVHGMADQSGKYQEWMSLPVGERHPDLPSGPFLVQTPDTRFPQGETLEEQRENPGTRMVVPSNVGAQWGRPDRGTWRWSYYRDARAPVPTAYVGGSPDITTDEMRLLAAEAHYRLGNRAEAADLINVTRTAAGLNATDADGTNTSCVPRLPGAGLGHDTAPGSDMCGGLFEMMKWEKRLEASHNNGFMIAAWYFEGRGWGDLMQGTIMQWPVPARDAELAGVEIRDYGANLEWGAPVGNYGY